MVELVKQNFKQNKQIYNTTKNNLQQSLGADIPIDHVGSTAIPNMVGKNIIDILIGAKDSVEFNNLSNNLQKLGYYPSVKSKTDIYQFFASTESETTSGDIHIHLVVVDTDRYNEFIILRDYLLSNPKEAINYANHKKQILQLQTSDRAAYRQIKSKYVTDLIARAKQNKKR